MGCKTVSDLNADAANLGDRVKENARVFRWRVDYAMGMLEMGLQESLDTADIVTSTHDRRVPRQIYQGISDDLTRSMVRELATTSCRDKVSAEILEPESVILYGGLCLPAASGVSRTMLEKQEKVWMGGLLTT